MKALAHLNKYFRKYKFRLIAGIFFVALSNLFAIFPAQVIRHSLDLLAENINFYHLLDGTQSKEAYANLIFFTALLFGAYILILAALKGIFMFFMRQTIIVMSRLIERDLKNEIFEHYQVLNASFYKRNNTGDLMARISEDVSRVRMYIGPAIMYTINLTVLFVLVISTMISVNPGLTLYVLLPMPVLGIAIYFISSLIEDRSDEVQSQLSVLSTFVQEKFSGIRVLKGYVREDQIVDEFGKESVVYKNKSLRLARVNAFFFPIMIVLVGLSTLLTVYIGGKEVIAGKATFGTIAEFIYYVNMLTWPFASVGWVTSLVQRAAVSQRRINEFLETPSEILSGSNPKTSINGKIEFRNVSYTYPDTGIQALKNISFVAEKGTTIAIVGRTGSGKSTMANVILRTVDVGEGSVLIDDVDLRDLSLKTLRRETGYVPQEVFLFSDTIRHNIAFGSHDKQISTEKIEASAKEASVYENIMEFPKGFETVIGERGVTLSGGQKQRISIARALIRNPKIIVFDDCLSAVDTGTEEQILKSIRNATTGRTAILISHRVSTIKHAHLILVLDHGMLVEHGTHEELLALKGFYHKMYEMQLLEEEVL